MRDPSFKQRAKILHAAGESYTSIAKKLGVHRQTVRRWLDARLDQQVAPRVHVPSINEVMSSVDPVAATTPLTDPSEDQVGGLEAALKAAGAGPTTASNNEKSSGTLPPGSEHSIPQGVDAAIALIQMVQALTIVACRAQAARLRIPWDDELSKMAILSKDERETLMIFAPAAAPYVMQALAHSDKIAAAVFAFCYWSMLSDRFGRLKSAARQTGTQATQATVVPPAPINTTTIPSSSTAMI